MPPGTTLAVAGLLLMGAVGSSAEERTLRIFFDPAPEIGIPAEARSKTASGRPEKRSISDVLGRPLDWISIRYFEPGYFPDDMVVRRYLQRLLESSSVSTAPFPFWSEALMRPTIEAHFGTDGPYRKARLLVWRQRAAYQDLEGVWWFTAWDTETEDAFRRR